MKSATHAILHLCMGMCMCPIGLYTTFEWEISCKSFMFTIFGGEWQYFHVSICVGDSYDEKDNDDMDNSTLLIIS